MEKRSITRHGINVSAVCDQITTSASRKVYNGKILNYSEDGLCIETSAELKNGAIVIVKVNAPLGHDDYSNLKEGFRTVSLAEIKWFKPSYNSGKSFFGLHAFKYY